MSRALLPAGSLSILLQLAVGFCPLTCLAGKPKPAAGAAVRMPYPRRNASWGPGTYYAYAPGTPKVDTIINGVTALRDMIGLSQEDCLTELARRGYQPLEGKALEAWPDLPKEGGRRHFQAADKTEVISFDVHDTRLHGHGAPRFAVKGVQRHLRVPKETGERVVVLAWNYLREYRALKLVLGGISGGIKGKGDVKADPPTFWAGNCWNAFRSGYGVMRVVNGKPTVQYYRYLDLLRAFLGKDGFFVKLESQETDFGYAMETRLGKPGYLVTYSVNAATLADLEPGTTWAQQEPFNAARMRDLEKVDATLAKIYKSLPLPVVMEDLATLLDRVPAEP